MVLFNLQEIQPSHQDAEKMVREFAAEIQGVTQADYEREFAPDQPALGMALPMTAILAESTAILTLYMSRLTVLQRGKLRTELTTIRDYFDLNTTHYLRRIGAHLNAGLGMLPAPMNDMDHAWWRVRMVANFVEASEAADADMVLLGAFCVKFGGPISGTIEYLSKIFRKTPAISPPIEKESTPEQLFTEPTD